jgi:hypothetical protein
VILKPERHRCPAHLRWIATIPCIACSGGRLPGLDWMDRGSVSQAHHLTHAQLRARGLKVGDQWAVPMCPRHHDPNHSGSVHANGAERAWWAMKGIDPLPIASALWTASVAAGRVRNIERKAA